MSGDADVEQNGNEAMGTDPLGKVAGLLALGVERRKDGDFVGAGRRSPLGLASCPLPAIGMSMSNTDDDYVYDEVTGEWIPASEAKAAQAATIEVRDASGNVLADGDAVVLIKDLKVKGAGQTLKQGTVIRSIRLTDDPEEIDCRHDRIKGLVLRTEFVRKR